MIRAFIVGSPRSGTTLLQRVLSGHPDLTSFPETHFFYALYGGSRTRRIFGLARREPARARLVQFLNEAGLEGRIDEVLVLRSLRARPWVDLLVRILDGEASGRGARGWLEKTPMHLHYMSVIRRHLPDAKFLHIIRAGEDVAASVAEVTARHPGAWGGARTVREAAERWRFDISQHRRCLGRPGHWFVRFEELVEDPEGVARAACAFLGVDFMPRMLEFRSHDGIVAPGESWKNGVRRPVSATESTTAADRLPPGELREVRSLLDGVDLSGFTVLTRRDR